MGRTMLTQFDRVERKTDDSPAGVGAANEKLGAAEGDDRPRRPVEGERAGFVTRRIGAGLVLAVLAATSVSAQTSLSIAMRRAGRVVGTHETLPATANGLVVGASTRVAGRLGAWASWTNWPAEIGQTVAFGGRWNLARREWKLRPAVLLGMWRKPERGAPWELIFGGGVAFGIGGRWSGSVALGVITIRSAGLAYAVPQTGVAYTLP